MITRGPGRASPPPRTTATRSDAAADAHAVIDLTSPAEDGTAADLPPTPDATDGVLGAFRWAVAHSPGYRDWLARRGVDPASIGSVQQIPYLTKADVFGGDTAAWLVGGDPSGAAELIASSGHTGAWSLGVTSRDEQAGQQAATDAALRAMGAGDGTRTLLVNCLPMGIAVRTALATVATPSVHLEMAQELLERWAPQFDLVIVLSEPVFGKELAERLATAGVTGSLPSLAWVVGGEWVSESWRRHVGDLLGLPPAAEQGPAGILVSLGAAELGLHLLHETPALRAARSVLCAAPPPRGLFDPDLGFVPTLLTADPSRLHVEHRRHDDGDSTLVLTPLGRRMLPLVRYDLGDAGEVVPTDRFRDALRALALPDDIDGPVVACWGRRAPGPTPGGVPPELVKEWLFAVPAHASAVTGRFCIADGAAPVVHVQLRPGRRTARGLDGGLERRLRGGTGGSWRVRLHAFRDYPFHLPGDHEHKPRYRAAEA